MLGAAGGVFMYIVSRPKPLSDGQNQALARKTPLFIHRATSVFCGDSAKGLTEGG